MVPIRGTPLSVARSPPSRSVVGRAWATWADLARKRSTQREHAQCRAPSGRLSWRHRDGARVPGDCIDAALAQDPVGGRANDADRPTLCDGRAIKADGHAAFVMMRWSRGADTPLHGAKPSSRSKRWKLHVRSFTNPHPFAPMRSNVPCCSSAAALPCQRRQRRRRQGRSCPSGYDVSGGSCVSLRKHYRSRNRRDSSHCLPKREIAVSRAVQSVSTANP